MTDVLASGKVVSASAVEVPIEAIHADAQEPRAGLVPLATLDGCEVGVWEHTAGASSDVEEDEVFVVVSGSATIAIVDGGELHVTAGDVVRLSAGMRTTWTVHETLRKIYVCNVADLATPSA
ncbi:cupin domain-containing protein [Demequina aurantiaca]|uniref:cupin domain-containing protein n=1 Tax=Demequina aurantiaca TaxID=676200 RepID=UPI0007833742|nr:cupin domain-containing protein [Demequina aurantiaca]